MDNFDWTQFTKRIYINASLVSVYNAWTKSEDLEKWFLSKASFTSKSGLAILPTTNVLSNSNYTWKWFAQNHEEKGRVSSSNGTDCIIFSFAGDCQVKIQLAEVNNQVFVELTQSQIPLDNNAKEGIRLGCAFGWTFYLLNLKSVLEGGLDLRNKDTELIGVVNN